MHGLAKDIRTTFIVSYKIGLTPVMSSRFWDRKYPYSPVATSRYVTCLIDSTAAARTAGPTTFETCTGTGSQGLLLQTQSVAPQIAGQPCKVCPVNTVHMSVNF